MSVEQNKAATRKIYEEAFNKGNVKIADEIVTPDFIDHEAPGDSVRGPAVCTR